MMLLISFLVWRQMFWMLAVYNSRALHAGTISLFPWHCPSAGQIPYLVFPFSFSDISLCIQHLPWTRITSPNQIYHIRLHLCIFLATGHKKPEEEICKPRRWCMAWKRERGDAEGLHKTVQLSAWMSTGAWMWWPSATAQTWSGFFPSWKY